MPAPRLAVRVEHLRLPFREALAAARTLGAEGITLEARGDFHPQAVSETGLRQVRKWLDDFGLRVTAVGFHTRRGYAAEDELDRRVEATKAAFRLAHALGAPLVLNHLGRLPAPDTPAWQLLRTVLTDLGVVGQRTGALLAAETGTEDGPALRRLLDDLPPASLAVALDPASLIVQGHAPLDVLAAVGDDVRHVIANDATRDASLGQGFETPLGRGQVDWPALLAALEERDYRGWLAVERKQSDDPTLDLGQALRYLRQVR